MGFSSMARLISARPRPTTGSSLPKLENARLNRPPLLATPPMSNPLIFKPYLRKANGPANVPSTKVNMPIAAIPPPTASVHCIIVPASSGLAFIQSETGLMSSVILLTNSVMVGSSGTMA